MKTDVIIIGQNYSTSLALIKAAGEAGHLCSNITCSGNSRKKKLKKVTISPLNWSKYTKDTLVIPRESPEQVARDLIIEKGDKTLKKVILPADDYCAEMVDTFKIELEQYFVFPQIVSSNYDLHYYMDKEVQKSLCENFGIPTARNWAIRISKGEVPKLASDIIYPCITKPKSSVGMPKEYIKKCPDKESLEKTLLNISAERTCEILIEEYIDVESEYTIPGISDGVKVFIPAFLKKTNIGVGDHRGVTICGKVENASRYSDIRNKLVSLMENIHFSGNFDIEVLYSKGRFYLNEINFRNGAAGYSLTKAGLNLPAMFIDSLYHSKALTNNYCSFQEQTFVNDKAALDYYLQGNCTFSEYKQLLKKDIHFIDDISDFGSQLAFRILRAKQILRYHLYNFIH